jgi:uncharacterized protein
MMTYQIIHEIFEQQELDVSPPEAHGMACAMLCVDNRADAGNWLAQLFEHETQLSDFNKKPLIALFEQTRTLLNPETSGFDFDLLLPDTEDLAELAVALSAWCQGFLWGIGYSHSGTDWPVETNGILKDMVEMTKLDAEIEEDNEDDQEAFMQLHQYLRAAVLMIRDELTQSSDNSNSH